MLHLQTYREPSLSSSPSRSPRTCEDWSLEEGLIKVIHMLKTQMDTTMNNLEESRAYTKEDQDLMVFVKMVNAVELMQMHLELTLELLLSKSEEDVTAIKNKFSLIGQDYDKIKSHKDMSLVTIKSVVAYMLDQMRRQLITVLEACFKKTSRGDVRLLNTKDNLAQATILTFKFEVGALYYPKFVMFPQDDIFSFEKSSPLWQDLYECAIYKKIITKQEIHSSFKQLRLFLHMSYYLIRKYIEEKPEVSFRTACSLLHDVLYYGIQAEKVEIQSLLYLVKPNIEYIFKAWHATDHPFLVMAAGLRCPRVGHDQLIYLPRLFPSITRELILKEYEDQTLNRLHPIDMSQMHVPDDETLSSMAPDILEDLLVKTDEKIQVRILAPEKIKIPATNKSGRQGDHQETLYKNYMEASPNKVEEEDQAIVIHIHGGGFVSMSSASHKIYLTRWVKNLRLIHFSIDYRLAPKDPYPAGLDDVWQAYLWIMNYSSKVLGIKTPKVIFAGDSAGGNLCLVLALRLIRAGLPPPDGLLLIYPCLTLDETNCSPSYYNALEDPILHYNILKMCLKSYVNEEFDPAEDPFLSPLKACDELMKELPPVRIVTGSEDPLHDDSWRLVARLRKLKKDVKIIIHEHMGHGFLAHLDLKNYNQFVEEDCELIRELISMAPKK